MAAEFEIQKTIYLALSGDPTLSALVKSVTDVGMQAANGGSGDAFPYVEVGFISLSEYDTHSERGFDFLARIHTWSRSSSMKECKEIQGAMYDVLHLASLTIVGQSLILLRREDSDTLRTADGAFHGVCEYRGLVETN